MCLLAIIFGYSVTVLNLQILHTRMEAKNMRSNRIWNRVAGFMQQLRCESLSQKNIVQMPEQQRIKKELEKARIVVEEQMNHMEETERRVIQEWIEYLEDDASLEAQQAYCQGYVDCMFLLSGMGMIEKDNTVNEFLDYMKK